MTLEQWTEIAKAHTNVVKETLIALWNAPTPELEEKLEDLHKKDKVLVELGLILKSERRIEQMENAGGLDDGFGALEQALGQEPFDE